MVAGPCCVFGATAKDGPPDVVVGEGAASDGVASFDGFEEERGGTSSSDARRLPPSLWSCIGSKTTIFDF